MSLSEREPKAEAVVLARKAEDDAKAMQWLASKPEISDHAVPLRYDEILDTEPLDRQAVVRLVEEVGEWAGAQLRLVT